MSIRHLSRSIVLQSFFAWDFNRDDNPVLEDILNYNIKNFGAGLENEEFIRKLAKGIFIKKDEIDKIINKAAPAWPLDQIAAVDRNVLRLGLYELLFVKAKEIPPKVAINEAIELAKTFGGETSGKFVNGVLGTVYREFEEVKKEEPKEEENLAGAIVYKKEGDGLKFALVHDIFGYWTFPKGKINENETLERTAQRKIKEEININAEIKEKLGANSYVAYNPEKGKILKNVSYFLSETKDEKIELGGSEGLDGAKWFFADELPRLNIYGDLLPFLTKAIKILAKSG